MAEQPTNVCQSISVQVDTCSAELTKITSIISTLTPNGTPCWHVTCSCTPDVSRLHYGMGEAMDDVDSHIYQHSREAKWNTLMSPRPGR